MKRPAIAVKRGEIRLEGIYVSHVCSHCVVVSIDCGSKYPQYMVAAHASGLFEVLLYADEHTLRPDPTRKSRHTEVKIVGLPRPSKDEVWLSSTSGGRYEVIVTLTRFGIGEQVWRESAREQARYCCYCGQYDGHAKDCAAPKKRRAF